MDGELHRSPPTETPAAPRPSVPSDREGRLRHRQWDLLVAVGAGGALGTLGRYELGLAVPTPTGGFPWAIFIVNVTGALVLGFAVTLALAGIVRSRYVRPAVGIGFCGGLTTFSTWMVDTVNLSNAHHAVAATLNLVATLTAGLVALFLGVVAARLITRQGARS